MVLPSGRRVRGRSLRTESVPEHVPDFGLYLQGRPVPAQAWQTRWIKWPDFWLPSDRADFLVALRDALERSGSERVELACSGGFGRTGTALACLGILDGVPASDAVDYVRRHYSHRAVETPWQRGFVARFPANSTHRSAT
jgi:protein-tyrosine phosphatase